MCGESSISKVRFREKRQRIKKKSLLIQINRNAIRREHACRDHKDSAMEEIKAQ